MKNLIILLFIGLLACDNTEQKIAPNIKIGTEIKDGVVFYLFKEGDSFYIEGETHGLIAAKKDTSYYWGCNSVSVNDIDESLGGGKITSEIIVSKCTNSAAEACKDWYLPNINEFKEIYKQRNIIPNLQNNRYWTSNVSIYSKAYTFNPYNQNVESFSISETHLIRPIKQF